MSCTVSVYDAAGTRQFSQAFRTPEGATDFLEQAIDPMIADGATYVVVVDSVRRAEKKFRAQTISDCILTAVDWWSHAVFE